VAAPPRNHHNSTQPLSVSTDVVVSQLLKLKLDDLTGKSANCNAAVDFCPSQILSAQPHVLAAAGQISGLADIPTHVLRPICRMIPYWD